MFSPLRGGLGSGAFRDVADELRLLIFDCDSTLSAIEGVDELARVRRQPRDGERVRICGSDPLNLVGILTPGARVSAVRTREIIFVDGLPTELEDTESARIAKSTPVNVQANVITRVARASDMATAISAGINQGTSAETNGLPKGAANTATKSKTNTQEGGAERPVSSTQMELR